MEKLSFASGGLMPQTDGTVKDLLQVMKRDGVAQEQVEARMRHQLSDDERCSRSKYAIVNIELDELEDDVEQLHRRLCYDAHNTKA